MKKQLENLVQFVKDHPKQVAIGVLVGVVLLALAKNC